MSPRTVPRAIAPALLIVLLVESRALTSGPLLPTARFWSSSSPSEPLDRYLDGHLGILEPTYDRPYLYIAYRHLSGLGLDAGSRAAMADYFASSPPPAEPYAHEPQDRWLEARGKIFKDYRFVIQWRDYTQKVGSNEYRAFYLNCLGDAFLTAANTLNDRIARFGADSDDVRAWAAAQDQVFSNCEKGDSIPEPLGEDASPTARADRAYQIAAAHFYAGHFADAQRLFRSIAEDKASPWHTLGAYLVARAMLREAVLRERVDAEQLRATEAYLRELLSDPSLRDIHPAAQRLLDHVRVELDPVAMRRELAAALTRPSLEPPLRPVLSDYLWILFRYPVADTSASEADIDELSAWLERGRAAYRWRASRSLPWLVAAAMDRPNVDELLQATSSVDPASPAYLSLAYHRTRLLMLTGRLDEARGDLDRLLREQGADLALGDRNRLLSMRTELATSVTQFFQTAPLVPVEVGLNIDGTLAATGFEEFRGRALFDYCSTAVLDRDFTPRMLLDALRREELTAYLRRRLALAAWTRAVLAAEDDTAVELAPLVAELAPELRAELDAFLAASPGEARQFATAMTLLRFPGMHPNLRSPVGRVTPIGALDRLGDNWWCRGRSLVAAETEEEVYSAWAAPSCGSQWWRPVTLKNPAPVGFLTAEERAQAAQMRDRLRALDPGPTHLGRIVLAWAETHRDDERVPEALHRVVKATRFGCHIKDDGALSKVAFQLLHRRYPESPWAAKTKYWYR